MNEKIELYLDYIRTERKYSSYTEENYMLDLTLYEEYLKNKRINYLNISYNQIINYISYLKEIKKLNSVSINRHLSSLRSFYNFLLLRDYIHGNPFKIVKSQKQPLKLPNYMKYSEFEELINSCKDDALGIRNRAIIELLFASGARIGELINLKIKDIDFSNNELKVLGKGNKERICYFNNVCKDALNKYIKESRPELLKSKVSDYLLINHLGNKLTDRGVRDIIDKLILNSSIKSKITPHTFRHTFATMLLNEGCDLKSVQELLGHVNLSTTSIYTHVTNDRIKDVYLHTHPRGKKK